MDTEAVKDLIRTRYGSIAAAAMTDPASAASCCAPAPADSAACCAPAAAPAQLDAGSCCAPVSAPDAREKARRMGYSETELAAIPDGANLGLGCGNPQAIAALRPGETVIDLGSGAGFDCFLAARQVGDTGRVIGVDMTHEMLAKARDNARRVGLGNVEFRLGELEHLPVADNTADVILSNCVINLVPDQAQVFREAFRVLRPNGRLAISDVVNTAPLSDDLKADPTLLCGWHRRRRPGRADRGLAAGGRVPGHRRHPETREPRPDRDLGAGHGDRGLRRVRHDRGPQALSMDHPDAVAALGALAHDHRLTIYRWLVEHGPEGLSAGVIAERLGVPPSSLTFHLQHLHRAGLIAQRRVGRQLIYAADFDRMRDLVAFLTENCCAASPAFTGCTDPGRFAGTEQDTGPGTPPPAMSRGKRQGTA